MPHLLIIEDEPRMASTLQKGFSKAGFETTLIATGLLARNVNIHEFDAVILDWMLPGFAGIDILKYWRSKQLVTPVLMLTAKGQTKDKVQGLEFGADDYMTKMFEWPELIARVNALLRRTNQKSIDVGNIVFDKLAQTFSENGIIINLTSTEHKILKYFFEHPSRLITRSSLIRSVYDYAENPYSNVIERHIKSIRKKCNYDPITTIRGLGYRLNTSGSVS